MRKNELTWKNIIQAFYSAESKVAPVLKIFFSAESRFGKLIVTAPLTPTPVIASPNQNIIQQNVAAQLFAWNPIKKGIMKECRRNNGAVKAMKKHAFVNPTKSVLWFLCKKYIKAHTSVLTAMGLSTAQKYKATYDNWSAKTNAERAKNAFVPFQDMNDQF